MRPSLLSSVFALAALAASACSSPASPSVVSSNANSVNANVDTRRVTEVTVRCPESGEGSQCNAWAVLSDQTGLTAQDVTGLATWTTSDATIATVGSTGIVSAHRSGEVAIRAAYRGVDGWVAVWAEPGEGLRGTHRTIWCEVTDGQGNRVEGVRAEILDGANRGRVAITSSNGAFIMTDLLDGRFTVRFSKPGYVTADSFWLIPGTHERRAILRPAR